MDEIKDKDERCSHEFVKCLACGMEGTPHRLLSTRRRKMTPAAMEQRRAASKLGGWKKGRPRSITDVDKLSEAKKMLESGTPRSTVAEYLGISLGWSYKLFPKEKK